MSDTKIKILVKTDPSGATKLGDFINERPTCKQINAGSELLSVVKSVLSGIQFSILIVTELKMPLVKKDKKCGL